MYAIIPMQKGERIYVGVTSGDAYSRHAERLRKANDPHTLDTELSPFEFHLRRIGPRAALHEYYIMVLEHVPATRGCPEPFDDEVAPGAQWLERARPYERFWIATLHAAINHSGWNVEHAPRTLEFDRNGRPCHTRTAAVLRPTTNGPLRQDLFPPGHPSSLPAGVPPRLVASRRASRFGASRRATRHIASRRASSLPASIRPTV